MSLRSISCAPGSAATLKHDRTIARVGPPARLSEKLSPASDGGVFSWSVEHLERFGLPLPHGDEALGDRPVSHPVFRLHGRWLVAIPQEIEQHTSELQSRVDLV